MNWRLLGTVLTSSGGTSQTTVQSLNFRATKSHLGEGADQILDLNKELLSFEQLT